MKPSLSQPAAPGEDMPRERGWQRLDPRRHVAAAVGLAIFVPVVLGALLAGELAAERAERRVVAFTQARLSQAAGQADDALMAQIQVRLAALQAAAAQWRLDTAHDAVPVARLRALQQQHPELNWIGVQTPGGQLRVATETLDDAGTLPGPPWLAQATQAPRVILHRGRGDHDGDALVLAVPLVADDGRGATSLLVARLPWLWLQAQVDARLRAMAGDVPIELLLLDAQGHLLAGPAQAFGQSPVTDPGEQGRYLIGRPPVNPDALSQGAGAGWQVVVREDAAQAHALAHQARQALLLGVLAVGLLAALAALLVTHWLLRRLNALAAQARAVTAGRRDTVAVPAGRDEVQAIGATLAELIARLQAEKAALAALNADLDARVSERSQRIERLAEDARHAAVTRERLRLARALHDTLAQSLMALLTQIRMVRKLGPRWDRERLDGELADAERLAASGLTEARAAIVQIRRGGLRDSGLAAELQALLAQLAQHHGIHVVADIDGAAAELVDSRAATVLNMVREALRNVARHAHAHQVTLSLIPQPEAASRADGEPRHWRLTLCDDGVGFDPSAPVDGHFGLLGLREQAAQLGATLQLDSAPDRGCRLRLDFTA